MFVDTSILIEILHYKVESDEFQEIYRHIKDVDLFISVIQLGEISDWSLKNSISPLDFLIKIKRVVNIVPLTEELSMEGSKLKYQFRQNGSQKFGLVDGIILASARLMDETLLTKDNDFIGVEDVTIL